MSVINTNTLSLIAQGNLQKSQSALGTAITDRKFNRMRPSMARVLGLETRSAKEG